MTNPWSVQELETLMTDVNCECESCKAGHALCQDWRAMREALVEVSKLGSDINDTDASIILAGLRLKP